LELYEGEKLVASSSQRLKRETTLVHPSSSSCEIDVSNFTPDSIQNIKKIDFGYKSNIVDLYMMDNIGMLSFQTFHIKFKVILNPPKPYFVPLFEISNCRPNLKVILKTKL
jgi:hypothetical protein